MASSVFKQVRRLQSSNLIKHTYSDVTEVIVDDLFNDNVPYVQPVGSTLTLLGAGQ